MDTNNSMNFKEMKEIVSNDEHFQKWVHGISAGTHKNYLYSLSDFCVATSKTPTQLLEICKKDYSKPPWEREIDDWFIAFDNYCETKNIAKETFKKRKTNVRGFFRFNRIDTPITRRGNQENFDRANDRPLPTKEELILLINSCKTIKEKAIILTQFSSGLSNSDIVKLTVGQFRKGTDNNNVCQIRMRRRKNENEFVTFLSPEAVEAVKAYLRVERENLDDSQPLFTKFKSSSDPLDPIAVVHTYARLCDSLGWTKDGNAFRKITGHMGRKWIKTNLTNAGMPREPLETLLGHQLKNGTDDNYYIMNEDHLKSIYLKYLPEITINPVETLTLESDEFKTLKEENINLKEEMEKRDELHRIEIEEMKARVDNSVEKMNKSVNNFEERWIKRLEENSQINRDITTSEYLKMGEQLFRNGGEEALMKMMKNLKKQADLEDKIKEDTEKLNKMKK